MGLINEIKNKNLESRKNKDKFVSGVLTTLIGEINVVGKNDGNRETTDKEAIKVIQKFLKGVKEMKSLYEKMDDLNNNENDKLDLLNKEIEIYENLLPNSLNNEELKEIINNIIKENNLSGMKSMGVIMKILKEKYEGSYDGKNASSVVKEVLK